MYNKLEALREKGVAEKMIFSNDYVSAREKLLKAQQLFPALDHIVPMLTVCDILLASRSRIPGYDIDHYWVLQLLPSSTLSDVGCRYQKLVTLLQPIKNKFPGTELALKIIQEAFSVLSDNQKRFTFDSKRGCSWADYESSAQQASCCHSMLGQNLDGSHEVGLSRELHQERVRNMGPKLLPNPNSTKHVNISLQEPSSFSSDVNSEGNSGEDRNMLVDDINSPPELHHTNLKETPSWSSKAVVQEMLDQDYHNFGNNRTAECIETGQIWAVHRHLDEPQNCRYAQINNVSQSTVSVTWLKPDPVTEDEKRWCNSGLPVACGSFSMDLEMSGEVSWPTIFSYNSSWVPGVTLEQFEIYPKKGEVWALYEDWSFDEWSYNPEVVNGCKFKLVEILEFSKYSGGEGACLVKVDGFKSIYKRETIEGNPIILQIYPSNLYMLSHNVPAYRFTGGEIGGVVGGMFELDQMALSNEMRQDMDSQTMPKDENSDYSNFTNLDQLTSLKPNSKDTILGSNRSLNDFAIGQVWAVYCGKDIMPRQYARLNNVIPGDQVCVTFLEPQPIIDYEVNRKKENLHIVCGMFRAKETTVNLEISQLSHLVKCQQSTTRPIYKIYPMKGEVWAMYQNLGDNENSKYCIVEIVSDFSGERTLIAKLEEVKGCLTFFQRQKRDGFDLAREVSKSEMLSFSHQIPAFRVPGIGIHGIPESSWHLEPNALPPNRGM